MIEEVYKGYTIKIENDDTPLNPCEEFDMFGEIITAHKRYELGHRTTCVEEIVRITQDSQNIWLPVYMLDHSGLWISTKSFNDPWDSGQLGIVVISKNKVREEYQCKRIGKTILKKVLENLRNTVATYNHYLTGNVWGYVIQDADGVELDSCCGYVGDYAEPGGALEIAKEYIDGIVQKSGIQVTA